nr:LRR receptor-like serine/threonine-protein kinase ERECTA [Ipomoea batatas]
MAQSGSPKLVVLHKDMAIHTYEDIMRFTENLSEKYVIGCGASSTVYKCHLKNSRPVAIKRIYTQHPYSLREFETELNTIGSIRHRNVVSLHGYSLSPHGNLLFYDYMENGSLWDLLHGKKPVDNDLNLHQLILSKADNNTVMEAVESEVSVTCTNLSHVSKTFQLALLCTKRLPTERPTMHEVVRVLTSLLPPPPLKPCLPPPKSINYAQFLVGKGQTENQQDGNSSDAQWLVRFREAISKNTL